MMDKNRACIPIIKENCAQGDVLKFYDEVRNADGSVDNVLAVHSLNVPSGHAHNVMYLQCMQGESKLTLAEREAVGVVVSYCNSCGY